MTSLLTFACITNSFRSVIIGKFQEVYIVGLEEERKELFPLIDSEREEDVGIFGERAEEIERKWYGRERNRFLRVWGKMYKLRLKRLGVEMYRELIEKTEGGSLGIWRQEFIAQYGEEP